MKGGTRSSSNWALLTLLDLGVHACQTRSLHGCDNAVIMDFLVVLAEKPATRRHF